MKTIAIILCSFVFASSYDNKLCDKRGTLFYESLSCKPKFLKADWCPYYFDCDGLDNITDGCLLNGKWYEIGDWLAEDIQTSFCRADCSCKKNGKRAEFQCAVVDCPEYENEDSRCYYKYELGYCCATQKICPPFSGITCKVGSNIYREGEQFFASDSCTECVCQKGFSGKFVEPFCRRIDCPIQLNSVEVIAKRCAPVYIAKPNEPLCCPTTFLCRNPTDLNVDFTYHKYSKRRLYCMFGTEPVAMGESFEMPVESLGTNRTAKCTCEVPPFVTCRA